MMNMHKTALQVLLAALTCAAAPGANAETAPFDAAHAAALVRLVRNDCGACHGARLTGGLGPALLPSTLSEKPPESLRDTILHGRPGTAMPPWSNFLSEQDADWIVTHLLNGFPDAR